METGKLGRKSGSGVYDYNDGSEKPAPKFEIAASDASNLLITASSGSAFTALLTACGVAFDESDNESIDGVEVAFTNGKTAAQLAGSRPQVVLDWMRDPAAATAIAFSASDEKARDAGLKLAVACGKKAIVLKDRPGLIVFRTLAQLANCAADAVADKVADANSIDQAMQFGVNYPFGPLAWARECGTERVASALQNIAEATGDAIYNPSEILLSGKGL